MIYIEVKRVVVGEEDPFVYINVANISSVKANKSGCRIYKIGGRFWDVEHAANEVVDRISRAYYDHERDMHDARQASTW